VQSFVLSLSLSLFPSPHTQKVTYREEKVTNVMGGVHGHANVGKVEPVAQPDKREGDYVVRD
jgi:hypothetical protein